MLGPYLRSLRIARGYTSKQLMWRTRSPLHAIKRIEQGNFSPGMRVLYDLCDGLDISFPALIEGLCRQAQCTQNEVQERPAGLTSDQRRAALFAAGQLTRCDDEALEW
nr:helix-turn-helix domain-containing protein [Enhygromyxa salina]